MGLGGFIKKAINIPNKAVMSGVAAIAGRDSWLGRRAQYWGQSKGVISDVFSYNAGALQQIARSRAADKSVAAEDAGKAAVVAEAKAHTDEVNTLGASALEALRNRRRRGLYATILTGSGPSPSASGKTTLGA